MAKHWEVESEQFIFFWGGVFSNWAKANFEARLYDRPQTHHDVYRMIDMGEVDIDYPHNLQTFNCAEQYMMAQKATQFEDHGALLMIMKSSNPKEQKAIGRSVGNFAPEVWARIARNLTYIGVYNKFLQNADLQELLLSTKNKWLVEASALDTVWGIGRPPMDTDNGNPANWLGTNWLGQVLMKVRDDIRSSNDSSFTKIDWTPYENEKLIYG